MAILDYFFSNRVDNIKTFPRKLQLPLNKSFLLYGARGVGKSYLIYDYLKRVKRRYLYIDCQDPIFIIEELNLSELEQFIVEEKIELLILDHYFEGFLPSFPKVEQIIVICRKEINLPFLSYKLYPLDFEEFLNFTKTFNIQSAFNLFSKKGSLPAVAKEENIFIFKELFFEKFETQEGKVLLILALFNTKIVTTHQLYLRAKEYFKISKDWLYKTIKLFEEEEIIYQIDRIEKGFGKKLILYDFAFSRYLNKSQTFLTTFDSIVALSLIKKNISILSLSNPIGYLTHTKELILLAPFDSQESYWLKAQKYFLFIKKLSPKKITILTISTSYEFKIEHLTFRAIAFYEWVIGLE